MAVEESSSNFFLIDETYEFSAPGFYDFLCVETEEDVRKAELWFENARPYAPSPLMPRIKASRTVKLPTLCDFGEDNKVQQATESSEKENNSEESAKQTTHVVEVVSTKEEVEACARLEAEVIVIPMEKKDDVEDENLKVEKALDAAVDTSSQEIHTLVGDNPSSSSLPVESVQGTEVCTPEPQKQIESKKVQTAKKIASMIKNPLAMKSNNRLSKSQAKSTKPASVVRNANVKCTVQTPGAVQGNHAIKRQKLEGGKSRQILAINKPSNLPHKTKFGVIRNNSSNFFCSGNAKTSKDNRKIYVSKPVAPFVSTAEMMRKFQSSTREMPLSRNSSVSQSDAATIEQRKQLTLTRPKTPEFVTSQRVRLVKVKSAAELEEEMMAKIPKFKARPLNKKILEAASLPPLPKSTPQPPEFKEFHLETMARSNQNVETSTVASIETTESQSHKLKPHITAPKPPCLQTSLRARPPRVKSSAELEKEMLENIPQFKAVPLNRKIFESKGDIGVLSNSKKQVTVPQEFHFSIDKRIPQPAAVLDLFDKLSISSESRQQKALPRNTVPNPFHLSTEERGAEKERRMADELMQKQLEEERARVPRAQPYPYTTDYPVIPPKPEPKPCTIPEPFQLESLVRHEEEVQREMEEKKRMEMEEAQMRIFKAHPILKEDPLPLPEKARKPLTEVQQFNLNVDNRAVDRAEFDKKVKEKEMIYKRYREEAETERMMEEEKALKQLRRTLVPHARPVPNFDHPFFPQRSTKEVTKAKSPKLLVNHRKEKRRVTTTSSTSRMR